jgi:hypothetical protein
MADSSYEERVTIPKFNDKPTDSFHLWKLRMEAIMESRDYFGIVNGTDIRPEDPKEEEDPEVVEQIVALQALHDKNRAKTAALIVNRHWRQSFQDISEPT